MTKKILIITGTITVDKRVPYLVLTYEKERLSQYIDSIEFYITESDFDIIIFGENSNYDYDSSDLEELKSNWKA